MKNAILVLMALSSLSTFADIKSDLAAIDATEQQCVNSPDGQSTMGMKICLSDAQTAADKILNNLYGSIVANLKKTTGDAATDGLQAETLKRLVASQRAWIAFRDANSLLAGTEMLGGTAETGVEIEKNYSMTKKRAIELNFIINGPSTTGTGSTDGKD